MLVLFHLNVFPSLCSTHILTFTMQPVADSPTGDISTNSLHLCVKGG